MASTSIPPDAGATQLDVTVDYGTLFVVATPIGNRDDLSPRARQTLAGADLIAAEDTRHTGRLLSHFGIETKLLAVHEHNEERRVPELIARLTGGASVALVSDAGTPLVSDPGYRLVVAAHEAGVRVSPVPGPSAVLCALSAAGLPTDRFCFEGFLPAKADARRAVLEALRDEPRTLVFLESVHKIRDSITDLAQTFGADRLAFIGRELTKVYEQCVRDSLGGLAARLGDGTLPAKGEFVVVVAGSGRAGRETASFPDQALLAELVKVMPGKQAAEIVARISGRRRNEVYREMLELKDEESGD